MLAAQLLLSRQNWHSSALPEEPSVSWLGLLQLQVPCAEALFQLLAVALWAGQWPGCAGVQGWDPAAEVQALSPALQEGHLGGRKGAAHSGQDWACSV